MASYNGTISRDVLKPDSVPVCSISILNKSPDSGTFVVMGVDEISSTLIGDKVSNLPVTEREKAQTGHEQATFRNDYYYRIHVAPQSFNFGAIISPINEEFIVWNSWFEVKSLSSIVKTNPTEYTLTGQSAPYDFKALQLKTYELDITEEGSTTFEATITFNFTGEAPVVTIQGTRVVAFTWEPTMPMEESLEWLTQILKGRSGQEQRISVRRIPRQGYSMRIFFADEQEQVKFENQLFTWQKKTWGVPVWGEKVLHTGTITAGDTTISVDTRYADFRDDSLAIVYQDKDNWEVFKIETKTDYQINLEVEMQNTFTGDKHIMPVRVAQMPQRVRNAVTPDGYSYATVDFLVTVNALITGHVAADTYNGLSVITDPTYVDGALNYESDGDIIISDCGSGPFDFFSDSDFNIVSQQHVFKNFSKYETWNFRKFLHHLYGRQVAVWIPTFKNDMVLTQTIGSSDTNFRISNAGYADNMGVNNIRTHIAFMFPDGTNYYREVTGITEHSETEEIISIDSSLGVEVAVGDCEICWLDKYRLGNDRVDIRWVEPNNNISSLVFVRVEE